MESQRNETENESNNIQQNEAAQHNKSLNLTASAGGKNSALLLN